MALYRYCITPQSAFATPLRSDTLQGHLLWAAAMRHGPDRVKELIHAFDQGAPPFVLSSAFPAGCLPMPVLPPIGRQRFKSRFAPKGDLFEKLQQFKTFRQQDCWPVAQWHRLQGRISQETLFAIWQADTACQSPADGGSAPVETAQTTYAPHVNIDRLTGRVLASGGLFFSQQTWHPPGTHLDLYVQTDDLETFEDLFSHVAAMGYGADRSTGAGQFSFTRDDAFDPAPFQAETSHQLCLSVCAAQDMTAFSGYWNTMVKHGRTWSGFGQIHPFKKPFFAFTEGSLFHRMPDKGYLIRDIHSDRQVVQICWPLTIPVTLETHNAD